MNIALYRNLSCQRREQEEYRIRKWMSLNGHTECDAPEADLLIFTSCGYDRTNYNLAIDQLIKMIPYNIITTVVGCFPSIDPGNPLLANFNTLKLRDLNAYFDTLGGIPMSPIMDKDCDHYGVHIATGCVGNCTYCGSCRATGKVKSIEPHIILENVIDMWSRGITPMLLAEDTGAYGMDCSSTIVGLLDLLRRNARKEDKIIVDNMDAQWFMLHYDALRQMLDSDFIIRLPLGVQSFNHEVLAKMNRRNNYDSHLLAERIREIADARMARSGKDYCDNLDIHLLVGYPGETREEMHVTMSIVDRLLSDNIPFCASPFFRHINMDLQEKELSPNEYQFRCNALYAGAPEFKWICPACHYKLYDCICTVDRKGKML